MKAKSYVETGFVHKVCSFLFLTDLPALLFKNLEKFDALLFIYSSSK